MGLDRLRGKVVVVTGASAGIGAAIAVALVHEGLTVVGVARREERVKDLMKQVVGAKGKLVARQCDVSNQSDIADLFEWVKNTYGTIQVLINNAGVLRHGKLYDQNPKYWQQILDTNVMGLAVCTQAALKLMKESGVDDGHIIHINSVMGHVVPTMSSPVTGMYAASKFAVTAMTETLRQELRSLGSKIRITSISPGYVQTEIVQAGNAAMEKTGNVNASSFISGLDGTAIPALQSEDIAEAVVYVLGTKQHVQVHELTIKPVGEVL